MKKVIYRGLIIPLLCSFSPRMGTYGTVGITICSYGDIEENDSLLYTGHSYLIIENNRSWSLDLGFYQLSPFAKCTIGKWGNVGTFESGSNSLDANADGVFFNREAYIFSNLLETTVDCARLYVEVDQGLFLQRMYRDDYSNPHYLVEHAEIYDIGLNNCACFARDFFYLATGIYLSMGLLPYELRNSILNNGGITDNSTLFDKDEYFRYDNQGNCYVYQ